jgi:hypothetical protein
MAPRWAQPAGRAGELIPDLLGVLVFLGAENDFAPADHRLGRKSSTRALRRMEDGVGDGSGLLRSKRPLVIVGDESSRSTANTCSLMPRIISPSTKAWPGAFFISSFTPHAWRTSSTSKSL